MKATGRGAPPAERPASARLAARGATLRCLIAALLGAGAALAVRVGTVLAASPSPSPAGGDVRTDAAPGVVGDPLFAVAGVLLVAALAVGMTLIAVRVTARR